MRLLSCLVFVAATSAVVVAADDFKLEPGFKLLFNGKNLDGWRTKAAGKDGKAESLDGKTDAYAGRYKVVGGELVIDPKVKGDRYIETAQELGGDIAIRFDFNPGEGCNNDLLYRGTKFDIKAGEKGGLKGVKVGAWNKAEVVVKGGSADFLVNGEKMGTQKTKTDKGVFTIRAEFGPIVIKNLRAGEVK